MQAVLAGFKTDALPGYAIPANPFRKRVYPKTANSFRKGLIKKRPVVYKSVAEVSSGSL